MTTILDTGGLVRPAFTACDLTALVGEPVPGHGAVDAGRTTC